MHCILGFQIENHDWARLKIGDFSGEDPQVGVGPARLIPGHVQKGLPIAQW